MTCVCVLGIGEAGSAIAADLVAAGVVVRGYDPVATDVPPGVLRRDDPRAAVNGSDIVLALTPGAEALTTLEGVLDAVLPRAIYADLSTSSAALKRRLAGLAAAARVRFVDVALMGPVPGTGLRTPALASGPAAEAFVAAMAPLGMPVEPAGSEAGDAATRKLLRSVLMKGLAALVIESLRAAEAAGLTPETWQNLVAQLESIDERLVRRLVVGTGLHAQRRLHELEATVELLTDLDVEPTMTRAALTHLRRVAADPTALPTPP